jgi:hypothetical protein
MDIIIYFDWLIPWRYNMTNNILENALKETWDIKDDFYEKNKNSSLKEIILKIENKRYNINAGNKIEDTIVPNI